MFNVPPDGLFVPIGLGAARCPYTSGEVLPLSTSPRPRTKQVERNEEAPEPVRPFRSALYAVALEAAFTADSSSSIREPVLS